MPGTFCVPLSRYSGISRGWSNSNARVPRAALYQAFQLFAVFRNEHTRAHRTV